MKFSTEVPIPIIENKITYDSKIVSIGSCFAENISQKLSYFQFQNSVNPTGILFHVNAIKQLLDRIVNNRIFTEKDVFYFNEVWSSFECHSSMNQLSKEKKISVLNKNLELFNSQLQQATHFILTLGTAWVYESIETGKIVANCHKVPQKMFRKKLLSIDEIENNLIEIQNLIKKIAPTIQMIYTISPVRHIKDGFTENQRSKAHLIVALQQFLEKNPKTNYYFPAYEILIDELRDYRFYTEDLIHPTNIAINFIWEKFKNACIEPSIYEDMKKIEKLQNALSHKPFNPHSTAFEKFKNTIEKNKNEIIEKYPFMNFE